MKKINSLKLGPFKTAIRNSVLLKMKAADKAKSDCQV